NDRSIMRAAFREIIVFLLSPTRFVIERLKRNAKTYRRTVTIWNWIFRGIMLLWVAGLAFLKAGAFLKLLPLWVAIVALWAFPFSRINELFIAYYRDAFQQLAAAPSETEITPVERLRFLVGSYFEVAVQFGILYFCFPPCFFKAEFNTVIQAVYFSVVTITTVGYGDITPTKWESQIACIYELTVGFVLIIFALGSYLATRSDKRS
ncbi:MAG TPA: ion channel, partial [Candidatus Angelobacter sp.]|nr:ion channel [Candidatus Angelobacter sp.]